MTSKTLNDGPWEKRFPLHYGAREVLLSEERKYVEDKGFVPDEADGEFSRTPLMHAVLNRKFEIVEYLLNRTSDVHVSKATSELWTPLMMAAREGDFDIVQLILEGPQAMHVDVNGANHLGHTALHIAILFCPPPTRMAVVNLLLYHGAAPNQRDGFGRSAVLAATQTQQHALANFLLAKTPVPVPPRQTPSRLVAALSAATATPMDTYGAQLVPNKWVVSGDGQSGDSRPPIAAHRKY